MLNCKFRGSHGLSVTTRLTDRLLGGVPSTSKQRFIGRYLDFQQRLCLSWGYSYSNKGLL